MLRVHALAVFFAAASGALSVGAAQAQLVLQHDGARSRPLHSGSQIIRRSFKSDSEALKMFREVLSAAGLAGLDDRIRLRASADTENAVAYMDGDDRFIAYNAVFMQRLQEKNANYWPLLAILAHEIGHHVRFHTQIHGRNHEFELEADYQAGFILRRMGATLDQATAVFKTFPEEATEYHPGRAERVQMVTVGWRDGGSSVASAQNMPTPIADDPEEGAAADVSGREAEEEKKRIESKGTGSRSDQVFFGVEVFYYRKDLDGERVVRALDRAGIPFQVAPSRPEHRSFATNSIMCGPETSLAAVKQLALTLLDAGVDIKVVYTDPDIASGRLHVLRSLNEAFTVISTPTLTSAQISALTGCGRIRR